MSRKKAQSVENVTTGGTIRIPWAVMDSQAFTGASFSAKALLIDLVRQSNGFNNGRLHACYAWLNRRGWTSKATIWKAATELTERGLIVQTRQGGLKAGASWYACTWLDIADFKGLDITRQQYHSGAWRLLDKPPTIGDGLVLKSGARNPLPTHKMGRDNRSKPATDPENGAITALFEQPPPHNLGTMHYTIPTDGIVTLELATQDQPCGYERTRDDQHAGNWDSDSGEFIKSATGKLRKGNND